MRRLEPVAPFRGPLQRLGFVYRAANPERTKRYFRESPGQPCTHIHVRLAARYPDDGQAYTDAKTQIVWDIIQRADTWAQQTGWEPGPSDA